MAVSSCSAFVKFTFDHQLLSSFFGHDPLGETSCFSGKGDTNMANWLMGWGPSVGATWMYLNFSS